MNLNFFTTWTLHQFFVLNYLILPLVFGEITKVIYTYDKDLEDKELFKNFNESSYTILNESNSIININSETNEKSPWFLNIPLLPVIVATSNSIPEGSCKRQLLFYLNHLKNGTLWATEMFDASAKYPYGLFGGSTRFLGSFDQCEQIQTNLINSENGEIEEIRSRYCLVDVKFNEINESKNFIEEHEIYFDPQSYAWEAIREKGDFRRYQRYSIQMALCFPAECQIDDIEASLKEPLDKFGSKYNVQVKASISPLYCSSKDSKEIPFSNYEIIFCLTVLLILTTVVISTIIDIKSDKKEENSLQMKLLYCFSARRNFNEIFKIRYEHRGLDTIHFIRVTIAALLICGHRLIVQIYGGTLNGRYIEWLSTEPILALFHNVPNLNDGVLGFGGLLLSYCLLKELKISEKLNYLLLILYRLFRLLPLYMFVTFAYATVFYRLGSGPFWEVSVGFNRNSCSSYWWLNLFLINNYFGGNNKCVIQSWYLSVDFQCFLIGLLLINAFNKMTRKIGYLFLACILMASTLIIFYVTYINNADPIVTSFAVPRRAEEIDFFLNYYTKTHLRLVAYVTGLIFGALINDYSNNNWRISKVWSQIIFLTAIPLILISISCGIFFTNPNIKRTAFIKALYASLQKLIVAYSVCSIPFVFTVGEGLDFYYKIITARWLQPLSRISFSIFLTHFAMFLYELGTTRTSYTATFYNYFRDIVGDMVYSVCLGLFFAILIEFPFKNCGNILLRRMMKERSPIIEKKVE
ncbi:O-acyltransferase like protein-like [Leptopilina boulardi]|uniref:O-acyltransferase like protein-like n=1 Tax=Leptopilina boulardi TaxID=63433 RepID=UPI0021F677EB|nr:O-acyltransferase like protein-like [Leptopilina boulardi]